jgi:A/G-specific adenine glycosylase
MEFDYIEKEQEIIENIRLQGISEDILHQFTALIIFFYQHHRRVLPWRTTKDPYHILVSEMMLQQTQVDRVIPKYINFISAFPDFSTLAAAPLKDVLSAWQGLGYNRRAQALHCIAHRVMATNCGTLPLSVEELVKFPGIGKATASAILVYAHNFPLVFIETNIRRVFIHFFFQDSHHVADDRIEPLVAATIWKDNPRDFYNSLMDYGSYLGKTRENPNRRSRQYKKQSPFEGSVRQVRGKVLSYLVRNGNTLTSNIYSEIDLPQERIDPVLASLAAEGFIVMDGDIVKIT